MRVTFFDGTMPTSQALKARAVDRAQSALQRFGDAVGDVEIRIADVNAEKGGIDKRCRILVHLVGHDPVIVEQLHADYYGAIDIAVDRIKTAVARKIRK